MAHRPLHKDCAVHPGLPALWLCPLLRPGTASAALCPRGVVSLGSLCRCSTQGLPECSPSGILLSPSRPRVWPAKLGIVSRTLEPGGGLERRSVWYSWPCFPICPAEFAAGKWPMLSPTLLPWILLTPLALAYSCYSQARPVRSLVE